MKKEAVQDERQKSGVNGCENSEQLADDMPVDKILEAEMQADSKFQLADFNNLELEHGINLAADHQLYTLVDWAKRIPHFTSLHMDDQIALLRSGWNELLISSFSHQSINNNDSIELAKGFQVYRQNAQMAGVGQIFDRVLSELIKKMREMRMDKIELGCLRAIVLYNPDVKQLQDSAVIEQLREKVYASLEIYCRTKYPGETGRFAKLLLRLPALRSIALKCIEHLFQHVVGDQPINQFLITRLNSDQNSVASSSGQNSLKGNSHNQEVSA